jgi:flagellar motor switch protein FliM
VTYGRRQATPESIRQISGNLQGSLLGMVVRLAETRISTKELVGLRVGDIITTEKDMRSPLVVELEGVAKFTARPGAYKGHKAIRIEDPIATPKP